MVRFISSLAGVLVLGLVSLSMHAAEVDIAPGLSFVDVKHEGKDYRIRRNQDEKNQIDPFWAKTSRKCPPFCVQPVLPVAGINFVGELELLDFLERKVNAGTGICIDTRLPAWNEKGTIPGCINTKFDIFEREPGDQDLAKVLQSFGAKPRDGMSIMDRALGAVGLAPEEKTEHWDFTEAKDLVMWCNGPWCGQSPRAIKALAKLGYPRSKIYYYRGGMQMWQMLGFPVVIPAR